MKKLFIFAALFVTLIGATACGSIIPPQPASPNSTATSPATNKTEVPPTPTQAPTASATPESPGYKNTAYEVDGKQVKLVNGISEVEASPGSSTKIITHYFGNEAYGDLNGDSKEDVAFLLTQTSGGSGTFYYAVAALRTASGYSGTNAVLLGDRIAPQSTLIENGKIVVNYTDRKPGEAFTTQPSLGVTKYLIIKDEKLVETSQPSQIKDRAWIWVRTQMNDGSVTSPKKQDAFTITFGDDGKVTGTTDCNRFFGSYTIEDNKLSFGPIASTKMFCRESQKDIFLKQLGEVQSFLVIDNQLVLEIKFDSGQLLFK